MPPGGEHQNDMAIDYSRKFTAKLTDTNSIRRGGSK
jgi:hypothetical protein